MKFIYGIMLLSLFTACTSREARNPTYSGQSPKITTTNPKLKDQTAKMLASEAGSNLFTQVSFRKGSSTVTPAAIKKLNSLYTKASKEKIQEVQIVTWADQEYPENQKGLAVSQQELVEKRNDQLEEALKKFDDDMKIKKVSMAKKTEGLAELADPTSAEVKESMEDVDIATKGAPNSGESKASRSIIIFVPKK